MNDLDLDVFGERQKGHGSMAHGQVRTAGGDDERGADKRNTVIVATATVRYAVRDHVGAEAVGGVLAYTHQPAPAHVSVYRSVDEAWIGSRLGIENWVGSR